MLFCFKSINCHTLNPKNLDDLLKEHLRSEEWYRDLFDDAHDLIHIAQPDGILVDVNKSWTELLGYSLNEIRGHSLFSFIHEADVDKFINYRKQILRKISPADKDILICLKTKSGQKVYVEGFVSVKFENDLPLYTRGIFRDVTKRIEYEAQHEQYNFKLNEQQNNLNQLLINAPDAVIVINKERNITFWNRKAENIFGWSAAEVLGKKFSDIILSQKIEAHDIGIKSYLETGVSDCVNNTFEITALNKEGKELFVAVTISTTKQNQDLEFIVFIRDISEQKENQMALERKTKELERSNTNLEDFAYAASHDLKEPIRKIHIFSDLLKQKLAGILTNDTQMIFDRMQLATERMQLLVDDLLEYSHVNKGIGLWETVDLNKKVQLVLTDLEVSIAEKNAIITVGELPIIKGHRRQLQQLFQNLISNSLKYIKPDQRPEITITSEIINGTELPLQISSLERQKKYYLIKVVDNGIGFQPGDSERIFHVFQRLHGNAEYKGTGIGLSIVRKVVQNHGGYITADGEPGKGATFKVYLPIDYIPGSSSSLPNV